MLLKHLHWMPTKSRLLFFKALKQAARLCVKWLVVITRLFYTLCKQCFLCEQVRTPLYGCDCYAYGLLSAGFCDLVVEADMKPYDYLALVPIVEGAGGIMTDWKVGITAWPLPLSPRPI